MDRQMWLDSVWQFLTRDVEFAQGFHSPMLSWLGAAAILALLVWHLCTLTQAGLRIRCAYQRVCPLLAQIVHERQRANKEWIVIPSLAKRSAGLHAQAERRDLDDLQRLDRTLRAEPFFAAEWLSFRKSFSVEQPSWFVEPTVQTKRSAAEFFSFEQVCAGSMNLRLYQQLPSLITGIGLTFTFLAILIGLSKLHAEGSHIDGMQGLINGLAGKFITSIVGLASANFFLVLEKSLLFRLSRYHRQFLAMLDDMFPQHVLDHGAQPTTAVPIPKVSVAPAARTEPAGRWAEPLSQRMREIVDALAALSDSLAGLNSTPSRPDQTEWARAIGTTLKQELTPLLEPLHEAVRELSHCITAKHAGEQLSPSDLEALVGAVRRRTQDEPVTEREPAPPSAGRLSWMFPPSGSKSREGALTE